MKFIIKPTDRFTLGFCNACSENCHNDCKGQTGCGLCANYEN